MSSSKIDLIMGKYKDDYEDYIKDFETDMTIIYHAYNKINKNYICLKVIDKKQLKLGEYDFHIERLSREEKITKLCNSENTINLFRKIENDNYIIFELEYFENTLRKYIENQNMTNELFKVIVIGLGKALKTLHEKGVMHRDIKPDNIYIEIDEDNIEKSIIKLGDFGCSIFIKDNTSEQIGSILYNAPELIKQIEYDEKCDLWSLGITLFETYFGYLPYGPDATHNKVMNTIYDEQNFKFTKAKIPNLNILFKRLLTINPKERMTFNEFFEYVFSKDFMNKDIICVNNNKNYLKLHEIILKQEDVIYKETYIPESDEKEKQEEYNVNKIVSYVETGNLPDIMNYANGSTNSNKEQIFNNIIYYDENLKYLNAINKDSDYFERKTPGAFILCTSIESFRLIRNEILKQIKRDKRTLFNLITTGSKCETVINFLKENKDFENCIKKICVYCMNVQKWSILKNQYEKVHGVYNRTNDVVNFINQFSSKDIKPFPTTKLVTYNDYIDKYKDRHFSISQFYGDLTPETYQKNIEKIKLIVKEEGAANELKQKNQNQLLEGFYTFDIKKDLEKLDQLIIKEYTKNTFYGDLNKWLMNSKMNLYEPVAYFTARLMYSLNKYANKKNLYCTENKKELHRGAKLPYICLLPYERAKGKIILLSAFTSSSESDALARKWAGRDDTKTLYKTNLRFSVVFIITNFCKSNWISNGINVQQLSAYKNEKEILYQPFSFYYVRDVHIDIKNYTADIYLETIGKEEILEEKIKIGKNIQYNENKKIMEIKN